MTRVLVTGGAGFLGSHLSDALIARGDDVTVLDNLHRGRRELVTAGARFLEGDVRDAEAVRLALHGAEVVYHLAAQSNVMGAFRDMDYSFTTNVGGTFTVLRESARMGVRRVVFASSREVYGEQERLPVPEEAPLLAKNPYGASKVAGEAYCRAWSEAGGTDVQILRFANLYGPRDSGRVIPLWLERAAVGEDLELYGGEQVLDFVPVALAVEALIAAARNLQAGPINVASGMGVRLTDLAERILALTGRRSRLKRLPARPAEVVRYVGAVTRMRSLLGIEPPAEPLGAVREMAAGAAVGV